MSFVQDNWWLFLLVAVSAFGVFLPVLARMMSGIPQTGVGQAVSLINRRDALVVDIRSPAEFSAGHIAHARNIPLADFKARLAELDKFKTRPVVVHCGTGSRSQSAATLLKGAGFQEVFNLQGGVAAWTQAGLPLEK